MLDNLNVHHDQLIQQMITGAGHRWVYRAPYWPKDGPIEYFYNSLESNLRTNAFECDTIAEMEQQKHDLEVRLEQIHPSVQLPART